MAHLILSPRGTEDIERLDRAARAHGWTVERPTAWRLDPDVRRPGSLAIYGEPLFARVAAAQLDVVLLEPPLDWLTHLPPELLHREVAALQLGDIDHLSWPCFLKPPDDKLFAARVYPSAKALRALRPDLNPDDEVLASEPVRFADEFRVHLLHHRAVRCSRYAVWGELSPSDADPACAQAAEIAQRAARAIAEHTPPTVVIDVGRLDDGRWAVVEANPCFGAGLYAGDPTPVLKVLRAACHPAPLPTALARFGRPVVLEDEPG